MNGARRQQLQRAYDAACYHVAGPAGPFTLRIGEGSAALAALYRQSGLDQAAYLTACNPAGERQPVPDNQAANRQLERELQALARPYFDGHAIDPEGHWPEEPSFLVLGLEPAVAIELGRCHRQLALILAGPDAVPRLRWLADGAD